MGEKVEPRRRWIEENVSFGLEENPALQENDDYRLEEENY